MTPALLARLNAALATLSARYGAPNTAPIPAPINDSNTLIVQPCSQYVSDGAAVKLVLTQTGSDAVNWVITVRATKDAALAWCDSVDAGNAAILGTGPNELLYDNAALSLGFGPIEVGDQTSPSGMHIGVTAAGPYPITPPARSALTAAIRAMLQ